MVCVSFNFITHHEETQSSAQNYYCYVRRWALEPSNVRPASLYLGVYCSRSEDGSPKHKTRFHSFYVSNHANLLLGGRPEPERMYRTCNKNKSQIYMLRTPVGLFRPPSVRPATLFSGFVTLVGSWTEPTNRHLTLISTLQHSL